MTKMFSRYLTVAAVCFVPLSAAAAPVHVAEGSAFRVDFSIGTSFAGGYEALRYNFYFTPSPLNDPLDTGEGWTVTVFDSSDVQVGSTVFLNPFAGGGIGISAGVLFGSPPQLLDSDGHVIFSDVIGSFDFDRVEIELHWARGYFGPVDGLVSIVPAPSTGTLLAAPLVLLLGAWRRRSRDGHCPRSRCIISELTSPNKEQTWA